MAKRQTGGSDADAVKIGSKKTKKRSTRRTKADKVRIAKNILQEYQDTNSTLESICRKNGISARTLHNWQTDYSEISNEYKKAKDRTSSIRKEEIREKAPNGLLTLIEGRFVTETETVQVQNKAGQVVRTIVTKKKKYIPPNTTAVIFALKTTDPNHWSDNFAFLNQEEQVFRINGQIIKF